VLGNTALAMPDESDNVELLRETLERVGAHSENPDALYQLLDPDVVWDTSPLGLPDSGVYVGDDGVREFWRRWLAPWEQWEFVPEEFVEAGNKVVVAMYMRGRGKGSGVWVEQRHGQVWSFASGKVVRQDLYPDFEQALRAAGITNRPPN
jgi:ketosteroid isomerase-like protein